MSWLLAHYHPVGMFSLKPSSAFSSAGKTLLTPTPYAVKMALLRVAIQLEGVSSGAAAWPWLRNLYVAVRLPKDLIVTHTVQTMLRAEKKLNQSGRHKIAHHRPSPTYREYVYYPNTITLALRAPGLGLDWDQNKLSFWLSHIDYLGKRDGFLQLERTEMASELQDFVSLTEDGEYNKKGVLQLLDDCGKKNDV